MIKITLNNKEILVDKNLSLLKLLQQQNFPQSGIAVAVNNKVIGKQNWEQLILKENDKLTVIRATCGG
ncbi:sulfur carrier protein ThiS [Coprobacter tertius]|uniref:Sulfur carrier protein ThiS n=1 Tax=Coprobacter tertius TaxID=2944915 RepID=A0ABT1MHA1_9BACT|nr:sulfur carrier protein ThiS [Coprobacter tertius]MCP9612019.1 sulfur carrier protein ThiS [Coprobacter tertius]